MLFFFVPMVSAAAPAAPGWLGPYDAVREELVKDHAKEAAAAANLLVPTLPDQDVKDAAGRVAAAQDLAAMRTAFGELSKLLIVHAASGAEPYALPAGTPIFHCSMTTCYGYWLQDESRIGNPFEGQAMPRCGEKSSVQAALAAGG